MPDIYLLIEDKQEGPYTEEQVRQSLSEGLIPADLPAWDGVKPDWIEVGKVVGATEIAAASSSVSSPPNLSLISNQEPITATPLPKSTRIDVLRFWKGAVLGFICGVIGTIAAFIAIGSQKPTVSSSVMAPSAPATTAESVSDTPTSPIATSASNVEPSSPAPPAYIGKVLDSDAGIDGVILYIRFEDAQDKETIAEGKVSVSLYDRNDDGTPDAVPFITETFDVTRSDFKDTNYGVWNALMITLPRIKYPDGYVPNNNYGQAKVTFVGLDGKVLYGEDNSLRLKPR